MEKQFEAFEEVSKSSFRSQVILILSAAALAGCSAQNSQAADPTEAVSEKSDEEVNQSIYKLWEALPRDIRENGCPGHYAPTVQEEGYVESPVEEVSFDYKINIRKNVGHFLVTLTKEYRAKPPKQKPVNDSEALRAQIAELVVPSPEPFVVREEYIDVMGKGSLSFKYTHDSEGEVDKQEGYRAGIDLYTAELRSFMESCAKEME